MNGLRKREKFTLNSRPYTSYATVEIHPMSIVVYNAYQQIFLETSVLK